MNGAAVLLLVALFSVSGCAADVGGESEGDDDSSEEISAGESRLEPPGLVAFDDGVGALGEVSLALGPPGSLGPTPIRGWSTSGIAYYHEHGMIYGMRVRSDRFVDQIQYAWYLPSNADNQFRTGDQYGASPIIGGSGGFDRGWEYCPTGYAAVGISGGHDRYIDRIGLICGQITNRANRVTLPVYGGSGGFSFFDTCASGGFMSGLQGNANRWVDSVRGLCRRP